MGGLSITLHPEPSTAEFFNLRTVSKLMSVSKLSWDRQTVRLSMLIPSVVGTVMN